LAGSFESSNELVRFHKIQEMSWLVEDLYASEEGLFSME
jgi:hypothetical protein